MIRLLDGQLDFCHLFEQLDGLIYHMAAALVILFNINRVVFQM